MHGWLRLNSSSPCISVPHLIPFLRFAAAAAACCCLIDHPFVLAFLFRVFLISLVFLLLHYALRNSQGEDTNRALESWQVHQTSLLSSRIRTERCVSSIITTTTTIISRRLKHAFYIIRQGPLPTILS